MNIVQSTRAYERWKGGQIRLRRADLAWKHACMRRDAFSFFRATFYRWMQRWPEVCGELEKAPRVLAVGDLHVENFGTWRDAEGRLAWGVNDFDEAAELPYCLDLVRLAVSAQLAVEAGALGLGRGAACAAILTGYWRGLGCGGRPIVLAGRFPRLRRMATERLKAPEAYWDKMNALPSVADVPARLRRQLRARFPRQGLELRWVRRRAGLGSLGHERITALADYEGGWMAREAKQLALSAAIWTGACPGAGIHYARIVQKAVRAPDPMLAIEEGWLFRRLAPDCSRIELASLPQKRDERRLLRAMGFETGNVHLGTGRAKRLLADLERREEGWLPRAAAGMEAAVKRDWRDWRKS